MKKLISRWVFVLALLLPCLLTKTVVMEVFAADTHANHTVCGKTYCSHTGHDASVTWTELSGTISGTLTEGNYYFSGNATVTGRLLVSGSVNICLNGKTVSLNNEGYFYLENDANITICDCGATGKITGDAGVYGAVYLPALQTNRINVYGGNISGGRYGISAGGNDEVNVYGGTVSGTDYGIALSGYWKETQYIRVSVSGATVTGGLTGISMEDSYAVATISVGGTAMVSGTKPVPNATTYLGDYSGISIQGAGSSVAVTGGTVTGQRTGVYINGSANATISGGTIRTSKTSSVSYAGIRNNGSGTITVLGGDVVGGAGIENSKNGTIHVQGGKITGGKTGIVNTQNGAINISAGTVCGGPFGIQNYNGDALGSGCGLIQISRGTVKGTEVDILGTVADTAGAARLSLKNYSGGSLVVRCMSSKDGFVAKDVAKDGLISLDAVTAAGYKTVYDASGRTVRLATIYTLSVNNGSGGGNYAAGENVTITANVPETGLRFKEWSGAESVAFALGDQKSAAATIIMPANDLELTATYEAEHDIIHHEAKEPTCSEVGWFAYDTCSQCDYTTYVEREALGHDEVQHEAKAPTITSVGWDAYVTCTRCDYTTYVELPELEFSLTGNGRSLSLEGEIYINQYVLASNFEGIDLTTKGGLLVWDHKVTEEAAVYGTQSYVNEGMVYNTTYSDGTPEYMVRTKGIAAKGYADEVYFRAYVEVAEGKYIYGELTEYSVQSYCQNQLNKTSTSAVQKQLCAQLLHYGAAAQKRFNYNVSDLANANILGSYPAPDWMK